MATATQELRHPNEPHEDTYRFWVNSGGEYGRNDTSLPGSSVNLKAAQERHNLTDEQMFDAQYRTTDAGQAAVDAEFARLAKRDLSPEEHAILLRVWALQKLITNDRFRVYGGRNWTSTWIVVVTEFCAFTDDKDPVDVKFWEDLTAFAAEHGAEIHTMHEDEHLDKSWNDNQPGHEYQPEEGREERAILGPNHGRPEKQVEVMWHVLHLPDEEIVRRVQTYAAASQALWPLRGVSVI